MEQLGSAQQVKARQASPVGQDLSELRSIVDTRDMEKIPIVDGNEANFAEWRFTFEATCGLLGLEEVLRQSVLAPHDEASLNVYGQQPEVSLKNKAVYYLLVASCRGRAQCQSMLHSWHGVRWSDCTSHKLAVGTTRCGSEFSLHCGGKVILISSKKISQLGILGSRSTRETVVRWSTLRFGWR